MLRPKNKQIHPGISHETGQERRINELLAGQKNKTVARTVPSGGNRHQHNEAPTIHRQGEVQEGDRGIV